MTQNFYGQSYVPVANSSGDITQIELSPTSGHVLDARPHFQDNWSPISASYQSPNDWTTNRENLQHSVRSSARDYSKTASNSIHQITGSQTAASRQIWKPISWMLALMTIGVAVGVGHHAAYQYLHNQPQTIFSQTWIHNLGSAAAFVVKVSFTLAVAIAFQEVLWTTIRGRAMKISLLDDLFAISANPLGFTYHAFKHAWIPTSLAAFAWIIPLSAIVAPGTLTVAPFTVFGNASCLVPIFPGDTIPLYAVTPHGSTLLGANRAIEKIASQIFPQGQIRGFASPCGTNCSFQETFHAPALKCATSTTPSFLDTSVYKSFLWYRGNNTDNWKVNSSMEITITYRNISTIPSDNIAFGTDFTTITCSPFNATYHLTINYTNNQPIYSADIEHHEPLTYLSQSESDVYGELTKQHLQQVNAVSLIREVYDQYLNGSWQRSPTAQYADPDTEIDHTILVGSVTSTGGDAWQVNKDLLIGVSELLANLTLSTLSMSQSQANMTTQCSTSKTFQAYRYAPLLLVLPYSIALLLSMISFVAGVQALRKTGVRTGKLFSQILVTTRNSQLDGITQGNSLSSSGTMPLKQRKLRLGELKVAEENIQGYTSGYDRSVGSGHAGLGLEGHVLDLDKHKAYW